MGKSGDHVEVVIEVVAAADPIFEIKMHFLRAKVFVNSDESIVINGELVVFLVLLSV